MSLGLIGGINVIEAASGKDGIAKAIAEKPDVIVLDLLMPGMDGTQTFLTLRKEPETEKVPVIFMTVKGMFSEFDNLKEMGALAVMTKPFDPTTLSDNIKKILIEKGHGQVITNGDTDSA